MPNLQAIYLTCLFCPLIHGMNLQESETEQTDFPERDSSPMLQRQLEISEQNRQFSKNSDDLITRSILHKAMISALRVMVKNIDDPSDL